MGSDGVILIEPSEIADARMTMFNRDGSEGMMCGNGIRCVAKYLFDNGIAKGAPDGVGRSVLRIDTRSGVKECTVITKNGLAYQVAVNMGKAELDPAQVPVALTGGPVVARRVNIAGGQHEITCCSMGNPHVTVFVPSVDKADVEKLGPAIEHDPLFPEMVNVGFVEVIDSHTLKARIWERGSGETWACGTGATASAVAAVLSGYTENRVTVSLKGGDLEIFWDRESGHVFMTGEATEVFTGEIHLPWEVIV